MPSHKPKSRQELLQQQRRSGFIGRTEQLQAFRQNLNLPPEDWQFLFNVSGQGGVGKTTLLKQFRQLAEQKEVLTAWSDDSEKDVPGAIGRLAEELEKAGHKLPQTQERYKVYRQKKQELEADPEAPQGFSAWVGKTAVKAGLGLAKQIPGSGAVTPFLDEEGFANKAGDWAAFVAKKLAANKDEVKLVQEPVETLTPIFLTELGKLAEQRNVLLLFDTYEKTSDFLDAWLVGILEGEYGELPMNVILAIAGRQPLEKNRWANYQEGSVHFPLDAFTVAEAKEFLQQKGVTQPQIVGDILRLSDRLPVLVAMLAQNSPQDASQILEPSQLAVERFLQWEPDAKRRQVALDGALPWRLNRDALAQVVGAEGVAELFAWLQRQPFVEERHDGWMYHLIVRGQMLRYKRRESPQSWAELHSKLAEYYQQQRQGLELSEETQQADPVWQDYTLQILYHRLCQNPQKHLPVALNEFLAALKQKRAFAERWAATMTQAGKDTETIAVQQWGEKLTAGLQAYGEKRYEPASEMFTALVNCADIELQWQSIALAWRGQTYQSREQYEEALIDFNQAIDLNPKYSWAIAHRGETYRLIERYEDALSDFNQAIELDPKYSWAIQKRGIVYLCTRCFEDALKDFNRCPDLGSNEFSISGRGATYFVMDQYEKALQDFNAAIQLNSKDSCNFFLRSMTYKSLKQYEAAFKDFDRAIEIDPKFSNAIMYRGITCQETQKYEEALKNFESVLEFENSNHAWSLAQQGKTYRLMERFKDALEKGSQAIEKDPHYAWGVAQRGETYRLMERYEEAINDFDRAIEIDPKSSWAIAHRGETYRLIERYEDALSDFNQAIELDPKYSWAIGHRGETYRLMERYEDAINDFDRAIEIDPKYSWAIGHRGATYLLLQRYQEALEDLNTAIEIDPELSAAFANRGQTYRSMERYEEALNDFDQAIKLDPKLSVAIAHRGQTYRLMERYEDAINDFDRAIELDPKLSWAIAHRGETYRLMERYDEAIQDFDRAHELKPENDWYLYDRSLAYQALNQPEQAIADITQAIHLAQQEYDRDSQNWNNRFNLALYHLAAGSIAQANEIHRQALTQGAPADRIQAAIQDLDDFLTVFPDRPEAVQMKQLLMQAHNPNPTTPLPSKPSN